MERVKIRMLSDLDQGVSIVYPSLLLGGPEFLKMTERRVSDFYLRIEGGQVGGMLQVWGEEALQQKIFQFFNPLFKYVKSFLYKITIYDFLLYGYIRSMLTWNYAYCE